MWILIWPWITVTVSQASVPWRRENYHSSRKCINSIKAGDSLSGSLSESEGDSTLSVFCLFRQLILSEGAIVMACEGAIIHG